MRCEVSYLSVEPELVRLDIALPGGKEAVIDELVTLFSRAHRTDSPAALREAILAREAQGSTGFTGRVAIPHCKTAAVSQASIAFVRLSEPVDFGGPDGPADLVFSIVAPAEGSKDHLKLLASLARSVAQPSFLEDLRSVATGAEAAELIGQAISPHRPQPSAKASVKAPLTILAVTSCPTGIAHTYMAADALAAAAQQRADLTLFVEPQGATGGEELNEAELASADAVVFANEVSIRGEARFEGVPAVRVSVKRALNEPDHVLDLAVAAAKDAKAARERPGGASKSSPHLEATPAWSTRIRQAVMTGVSYMVPFVAAGGLLIALGFALGGYELAQVFRTVVSDYSLTNLPTHDIGTGSDAVSVSRSGLSLYLGALMFATGQAAIGLVVAALSGFISFALAGRPGIAPGFIGGAISVAIGAGFIGGLATGIIAGCVAYWIQSWPVPRWLASLMPVVVIPLLTTMVVGLAMFVILGRPLANAMDTLHLWLASLDGVSSITLGALLGAMMCADLGGPINKTAYLFATAGLSSLDPGSLTVMATVMAAGMVPPLALSLATGLCRGLFTHAEVESGKSAWLLGLSFISEGAIPFAAADPFRVIPAMMAGGSVAGALTMLFHVQSSAPHGGIFVIFAVSPWWGFLLALTAGICVASATVVALKRFARKP